MHQVADLVAVVCFYIWFTRDEENGGMDSIVQSI